MNLNNQYKTFPFSYYCPQIIEVYKDSLSKTLQNYKVDNELVNKEKSLTLTEEIEKKIKIKYNLLIPALFMEIKSGIYDIYFEKEDLKNVIFLKNQFFKNLGEIKYIEINGKIAYVLYEYYFSTILAFHILKDMINFENKNQIFIKLMTREEEEKKLQDTKFTFTFNTDDFFVKENEKSENFNSFIESFNIDEGHSINLPDTTDKAKYICNYEIQIENDESFKVTSRIIGVKGMNVQKLLYESCKLYNDKTTKLRLRGKGSGYKEGLNNKGMIYNLIKKVMILYNYV